MVSNTTHEHNHSHAVCEAQPLSAGGGSGRPQIGYLRLSLTKSCALRCLYCRPATSPAPDESYLSLQEITMILSALRDKYGLTKVRLTGGEPTHRPELISIIESIGQIKGIHDFSMTTNGLALRKHVSEFASAGLRRLNISLDSLDRDRFAKMTGVDGLHRVLQGIEAARNAGLTPVKINTVVIRNHNEHELFDFVRFAAKENVEARFIELMPMGPLASRWNELFVSEKTMRSHLEPRIAHWEPLAQGSASARRYRVRLDDGSRAIIGFITPMSCGFCGSCDRLRIAADGEVFPCLMDHPSGSIMPALRPRFDPALLDALLDEAIQSKRHEHPHAGPSVMTDIGG